MLWGWPRLIRNEFPEGFSVGSRCHYPPAAWRGAGGAGSPQPVFSPDKLSSEKEK